MEEFLDGLSKDHLGKVIQVLEERGPSLPFPYSSQVAGRLRELRIHFGRELHRILYYCDITRAFVLLHGFEKRSQQLPRREIAIAIQRMALDKKKKEG